MTDEQIREAARNESGVWLVSIQQLSARLLRAEADVKACQEVYAAARALVRLWNQESFEEEDEQAAVNRFAKSVGMAP